MMSELEQYKWLVKEMEDKMLELMGPVSYKKWSEHKARELFINEMESLPDGDFKETINNNLSVIFGED